MDNEIGKAIAKLQADATDVTFTGYISNARQPNPPTLEGDVWRHIRAEASGRFADGHRIQTSFIINIEARGESLWVETENGSKYGILSFAPLGWLYFSNLHRAFSQLDPAPEGTPIFDVNPSQRTQQLVTTDGLKIISERRQNRESLTPLSQARAGQYIRPQPDPDYFKKRTMETQASITQLRRNGVRTIKHE